MGSLQKFFRISLILIVFLLVLSQEAEARRKILRGRKTLTRFYMRTSGVPAWAIAIIVGFAQIVFGGIVYVILKSWILDKPLQARYSEVERTEA